MIQWDALRGYRDSISIGTSFVWNLTISWITLLNGGRLRTCLKNRNMCQQEMTPKNIQRYCKRHPNLLILVTHKRLLLVLRNLQDKYFLLESRTTRGHVTFRSGWARGEAPKQRHGNYHRPQPTRPNPCLHHPEPNEAQAEKQDNPRSLYSMQ